MKYFLLCISALLCYAHANSQDIIIKRNGDEIKVKIVEIVGTATIKYKKWENIDGPLYIIDQPEVFKVKYANGQSDFFGNVTAVVTAPPVIEPIHTSAKNKTKQSSAITHPVQSALFDPSSKIIWLGIDFSHVQLAGVVRSDELTKLKQIYFPSWNEFIPDEASKYDIKGMLRKNEIVYDMDMIAKLNANSSNETLLNYNNISYTESDIKKFIDGYDLTSKSGLGILFLAESMNKDKEEARFHFVAFDITTKEILLQEKITGKPSGFGMRSFWGNSIHDVIQEIKNKRYKIWKKNYEQGNVRGEMNNSETPHPHDPLAEAIYSSVQKNKTKHK